MLRTTNPLRSLPPPHSPSITREDVPPPLRWAGLGATALTHPCPPPLVRLWPLPGAAGCDPAALVVVAAAAALRAVV